MQIAVDRSSPKTSESATRTSWARPRLQLPVQGKAIPLLLRPPARSTRATLEGAFGADVFAAAANRPGVGAGSGPGRGGNLTGIPSPVRAKMEAAFGADFSGVRVHPSSPRATALGALAYTQGSEIHFAPGQWAPETTRGQELLGHELCHLEQKREGRVQATAQYKGVALNDSSALEAEADAMGARAAHRSAGLPRAMARAPEATSEPPRGSSAVVQRHRNKLNPGDVATVSPSIENYRQHVALRVRQFFIVFVKAVLLWRKCAQQSGPLPNLFTNNAEAQAGVGFRIKGTATAVPGEDRHDAAHLTNITLMRSSFNGLQLSSKDQENLDDLYRATAATTPQFQTSNVTSDKIIDRQMTAFKNTMISALNAGATLDDAFMQVYLNQFLTALANELSVKSQQHPTATAGPADLLKAQSYEIALQVVNHLNTPRPQGVFEECLYDIVSEAEAYAKYNLT
ncbi:eCIS core domain-containing protein [Sorangium sp. So ce1182]|uniref:eCIS core domain-containing protein n=1 Tax=Sorangium sp. So ce1182 TaxID=3133334 RepID=UPI003F5F1BC0